MDFSFENECIRAELGIIGYDLDKDLTRNPYDDEQMKFFQPFTVEIVKQVMMASRID